MILVTGGTGFVGRSVLRRLAEAGAPVRTLLRPAPRTPRLPLGVSMEVALAALSDVRGLRAALVGVEAVIHLASSERSGLGADLVETEVEGTRNLVQAAVDAGVKRFIYVSHIGVDRASAYPLMRAKAGAEEAIRRSGINHTILRSAVLFGPGDSLTTGTAVMLSLSPLVFPIPGDGTTLLQPLWVEDLAMCIVWALDEPAAAGTVYEVGGPEFLTFSQVVRLVMDATGTRRILATARPPFLRALASVLERLLPYPPVTTLWLDYLAINHTAELSTLPQEFGLHPARMEAQLDYLGNRNWSWEFLGRQFRGREGR